MRLVRPIVWIVVLLSCCQRVLPAFVTDGYFSLVPGESRAVEIDAPHASGPLQVSLEGWNAECVVLPVRDGR